MKLNIKYISYIFLIALLCYTLGCTNVPEFVSIDPISFPYKFKSEIDQQLKSNSEPWKNQLAAWEYSYIGEYTQTLITWDEENRTPRKMDPLKIAHFNQTYQPHSAVNHILKLADTSKIIIINEAHHQPLHRVFTTSLLKGLFDKGFRYLGLETLDHEDTELNTRRYPIYSSGTYSMEPQFGHLIRKAIEIGYQVFPYESDGNGSDREIGQAKNIQQQLNKDTTGKYLIHCGFAHAAEGEYQSWGKAMAGRVHEFTGINPLTINQTEFTERSSLELCHPILQHLDLNESSIFLDATGNSFKHETNPEWFDIMIFHPKTKQESGRPNWLFKNNKKKVILNLEQVEMTFPILVLAFKENEDYKKAIPVDLVHIESEVDRITLALEKGDYKVIIQNQSGNTKLTQISVN